MKNPLTRLLILLTLLLTSVAHAQEATPEPEPGVLRNPLNANSGADPWLTYYEGNYYLATTTGSSILTMRQSPTLAGLKTAPLTQIYAETEPSRCCNMWAPEFHLLDGPNGLRWYFYYTAGTSGTLDNQHMHVLESAGTDPMGPYTYKARLVDPTHDVWSIDGSILQLDGSLYFLFSSWVEENQTLFIAPMRDPWTLDGSRHLLSQPEYEWEQSGLNVNEGPVALQHDDQTFIIYSASYCATPDYALGMLTYNGGNPLEVESWVKSPEPVFQRSDENSVFGPGHNGFFTSPDGAESWMVYHANDAETEVCDNGRTTRVQPFTWNEDGTPNFGTPVSTDTVIDAPSGDMGIDPRPDFAQVASSRLRAFGRDGAYLSQVEFVARIGFDASSADAQFILAPGLADDDAVSIESVSFPGYYVIHRDNVIVLAPNDGSAGFDDSATWHIREGLADSEWISFESYDVPGSYLGQKFGVMALVAISDTSPARDREDATFLEER